MDKDTIAILKFVAILAIIAILLIVWFMTIGAPKNDEEKEAAMILGSLSRSITGVTAGLLY